MLIAKEDFLSQYFTQLTKLGLDQKSRLSLASYFYAGYASRTYLNIPKGLPVLFELFEMLQKMEDGNVITSTQRETVFSAILTSPGTRIEKQLNKCFSGEMETYDKNARELLDKVRSLIIKHESEVVITENRIQPLDLVFWGFLTSNAPDLCSTIFEKIASLRVLQVNGAIEQEQKLNMFRLLYSMIAGDVQEYFNNLPEKTALMLNSPSTSAGSDDEGLSVEQEEFKCVAEKSLECRICLEDCEALVVLELCNHSFHKDCLNEYIQVQMSENKFPILCPDGQCQAELSNADLAKIVSTQDLQKFHRLSIEYLLKKNTSVMFNCPAPDCAFKLFYLEDSQKEVECPLCYRVTCLACKEVSHPGALCEVNQFIQIARNLGLKACPSCRHWVERTEGCNHMTCSCGYEFCYQCGRVYDYALAEEGGYTQVCIDGNCEEDSYYENFEKLLSLQEG